MSTHILKLYLDGLAQLFSLIRRLISLISVGVNKLFSNPALSFPDRVSRRSAFGSSRAIVSYQLSSKGVVEGSTRRILSAGGSARIYMCQTVHSSRYTRASGEANNSPGASCPEMSETPVGRVRLRADFYPPIKIFTRLDRR